MKKSGFRAGQLKHPRLAGKARLCVNLELVAGLLLLKTLYRPITHPRLKSSSESDTGTPTWYRYGRLRRNYRDQPWYCFVLPRRFIDCDLLLRQTNFGLQQIRPTKDAFVALCYILDLVISSLLQPLARLSGWSVSDFPSEFHELIDDMKE